MKPLAIETSHAHFATRSGKRYGGFADVAERVVNDVRFSGFVDRSSLRHWAEKWNSGTLLKHTQIVHMSINRGVRIRSDQFIRPYQTWVSHAFFGFSNCRVKMLAWFRGPCLQSV